MIIILILVYQNVGPTQQKVVMYFVVFFLVFKSVEAINNSFSNASNLLICSVFSCFSCLEFYEFFQCADGGFLPDIFPAFLGPCVRSDEKALEHHRCRG